MQVTRISSNYNQNKQKNIQKNSTTFGMDLRTTGTLEYLTRNDSLSRRMQELLFELKEKAKNILPNDTKCYMDYDTTQGLYGFVIKNTPDEKVEINSSTINKINQVKYSLTSMLGGSTLKEYDAAYKAVSEKIYTKLISHSLSDKI